MRPVRLTMQGFGAFRDRTEVDFTDIDLLALVGDTGAGKSTVIDAITFALYGSVARYDDNRAVAPVINQTSSQARVRLDFELGGRLYTAVRVVRRTAGGGATTREARLEREGEVLAADARAMSTLAAELLGLDVVRFNRTVVLPQGRFADFLHDKPADRQATLRQLLGLELYKRIGAEARARATRYRNQVDALQPELDGESADLTDERRAEIEANIAALASVRKEFDVTIATVERIDGDIGTLDRELKELVASDELLGNVQPPDDLERLDRLLTGAASAHALAVAELRTRREARQLAVAAVASGPDIVAVKLRLKMHGEAKTLAADHERVASEVAEARTLAEAATAAADAVHAEQQRLDADITLARATETQARLKLAAGPSMAEIDGWLDRHGRYQAAVRDAIAAAIAATRAADAVMPLEQRVAELTGSYQHASERRADLQRRAGVAAFSHMLAIGEPCPLCLHPVEAIPAHGVEAELAAADRSLTDARVALQFATSERDAARDEQRRLSAEGTAQDKLRDRLAEELVGIADLRSLSDQRASVERAVAAVKASESETARLEALAKKHRESPIAQQVLRDTQTTREQLAALVASELDLRTRMGVLTDSLRGAPLESELVIALDRAEELLRDQAAAEVAFVEAEEEEQLRGTQLAEATKQIDVAHNRLQGLRDEVASLRPPALTRTSLAADWATVLGWATERRAELAAEVARRVADREVRLDERRNLDGAIHARCEDVLGAVATGAPLVEIGDILTRRHAESEGSLRAFDERRLRVAELCARVHRLREDAAVAEKLGDLLRADRFEGWLMQAALERLVAGATVRLLELSGGQYSLELDDRTFAVRDHTNADELRSARTLSGGETFLASLALALALAEATAELAPAGAPQLDSIFLDEGFGTLDPNALETVAAAIEELGASGRLVGIITHIHELADRMPVRLEITKIAGSSRVERVEA